MQANNKNIYTLPLGVPALETIARTLLERSKNSGAFALSDYLIMLPTRRACRMLQNEFLKLNHGNAMFLPKLQALGDVDEEELSILAPAAAINIPPALPSIKRQILLSKLIRKIGTLELSIAQSLKLSSSLGQFLDQVYIEELGFDSLEDLVPEEFAKHWQITIEFLKILSVTWPEILKEQGIIDATDRRGQLVDALRSYWLENPPKRPVIIAGSTGSVPATARLMQCVASMEYGEILLPAIDRNLSDIDIEQMDETHPQFALKRFLSRCEISFKDVQPWENSQEHEAKDVQFVLHEIMRPNATTHEWARLSATEHSSRLNSGLKNIRLIEAENTMNEAQSIACLFREILEEPDQTVMLITPNRALAKQVSVMCKRWNIEVDDSGGQSLKNTPVSSFITGMWECVINDFTPVSTLSWMKNPLFLHAADPEEKTHILDQIERQWRGFIEDPDSEELFLSSGNSVFKDVHETIKPLITHAKQKTAAFTDILKTHIEITEKFCPPDLLWEGDNGEAMHETLTGLLENAEMIGEIKPSDYGSVLEFFIKNQNVRPKSGTHPRLSIFGNLEARMAHADLVILGGINEGIWPKNLNQDSFMSTQMRSDFGLTSLSYATGLSAHDFCEHFAANNVVITYSQNQNNTPLSPSRWITRLETVLHAAHIPFDTLKKHRASHYPHMMDYTDKIQSLARPEPRPPVNTRPKKLSVTQIERLMKDPYSVYAYKVLGLKPLEDLEKEFDAAENGKLIHAIFEDYIQNPEDFRIEPYISGFDSFKSEQIKQVFTYFMEQQEQYSGHVKTIPEYHGSMTFSNNNVTITAIADRIDISADNTANIIDYKTGGNFPKTAVKKGLLPQLPLEALILKHGGFEKIKAQARKISYWKISANSPVAITEIEDELQEILEQTLAYVGDLLNKFESPSMPYYAIPNPDFAPRYNPYDHLARVQEWADLEDESI